MNNVLEKLARYYYKKNPKDRTHYYRFRHLLSKKCGTYDVFSFVKTEQDLTLLKNLSQFAPLLVNDLQNKSEREKYSEWKKSFPDERRFFTMVLKQHSLWEDFKSKTILEFFDSNEGKAWFKNRQRLNRKPTFELDLPFKKAKLDAKNYELKIRNLLRAHPLLHWEDLKALGVRNAQVIYQNFPLRKLYRDEFLNSLKTQIAGE